MSSSFRCFLPLFFYRYGYLTWEWQHGLRGYLYPSMFALLYKILSIFGLDHRLLLVRFEKFKDIYVEIWNGVSYKCSILYNETVKGCVFILIATYFFSLIFQIKLPRILQGIIAAWGDLYLYKLSWKLSDRATAQWTLFCQITSWFTLYCCTRTLTNSMESVLVTVALYYFPWPDMRR